VFHCWSTGFVTIVPEIACFRGRFCQNDCNLPSACASGSGPLAAIRTVSSSSSSLDEVVFGHSAVLFTFAESSGSMLRFRSVFPARTAFPLFMLSREVSRLAPTAHSVNHCREGRHSRPTAGFLEL
jgi:hypothetical protein